MTEAADALWSALADRYRLERKLGAGGMATVYLALDIRHDRRVAVKVLSPHVASVLGGERFLREIQIAAKLTHPHIVPLLDSGSAAGFLFYVMPHIDGETLRERIVRDGEFTGAEASRILRDMADALAKAHSLDIVHRDIKPDNVMLADRHALVMDFGVAKAVRMASATDQLTTAGVTLGTPAYMAPEQAAGDPNVDHRADIYALGVVGYEMLCGTPPFVRETPAEVLAAHVTATPTPIEQRQASVAPELAALVMRCLEKRPGDRWQSAELLAHRLEQAATPSVGTTPIRVLGTGYRRFSPKAIVLAALVALTIAVVAIVFRPTASSEPTDTVIAPVICETCVAVFPFTLTGHDSLAMWETGAALLLGQDLDGAGQIRTVDHNALAGVAERLNMPVDPAAADQLTRDLWGSWYVLGSLLGLGDRNRLTGTLYHIDDPTPVATAVAEGNTAEMPRLVQELAAEFTKHLPLGEGQRLASRQRIRTDNYEALKAYLEGEQHVRRKEFDSASTAFDRAIEFDSTFGLARYRRAVSEIWISATAGRVAVEEAYPYRGQLTGVDSLLLEGFYAFTTGDADGAEKITSRLVREYPSSLEAWYWRASTKLWYSWRLGQGMSLARAPLERALELDPDHTQSQFYLQWLAAWEGKFDEWEATRVLPYAQARYWDLVFAVHSAFERGDALAQDSVVAEFENEPDLLIHGIANSGGYVGSLQNLTLTARLSELLTDSSLRSLKAQLLGWLNLARVDVALGRWRQATDQLDRADVIAPAVSLIYRAWLASTPFLPIDSQELALIRDAVIAWDGKLDAELDLSVRTFVPYGIPSDMEPHLRPYLVGLLSARLGDHDSATRSADSLRAAITPRDTLDLVHDMAVEVGAFAQMYEGNLDSALSLLKTSKMTSLPGLSLAGLLYMRPLSRLLRAEILYEQGALEEAAGWYSMFAWINGSHWSLNPWSHYRRGQIYDELKDEERAVRNYAKFVEQWSDAAPELQVHVQYARQRLEALAPDRAR